MKSRRCVALFSGGLDSKLAVRLMQQQNIEVEALNFKTIFTCCQDQSAQAARELGVQLTVAAAEDDYLEVVRRPEFGYGRGANPCVDCRIYMFRRAHQYKCETGADFVISGEIVGQRPMSQKRRDLEIIAHHSDLDDLLLRPLCAKNLPPTLPERQGWVDRNRLGDFVGRSRKGLIRLARELGITDIPAPSTGCALTEPLFSEKVFDLGRLDPVGKSWEYELLKVGRHFRWNPRTKVVVGRTEAENEQLAYFHRRQDAPSTGLARPKFAGPTALVVGQSSDEAVAFAVGLVLRYSSMKRDEAPIVQWVHGENATEMTAAMTPEAHSAVTIASAQTVGTQKRLARRDRSRFLVDRDD